MPTTLYILLAVVNSSKYTIPTDIMTTTTSNTFSAVLDNPDIFFIPHILNNATKKYITDKFTIYIFINIVDTIPFVNITAILKNVITTVALLTATYPFAFSPIIPYILNITHCAGIFHHTEYSFIQKNCINTVIPITATPIAIYLFSLSFCDGTAKSVCICSNINKLIKILPSPFTKNLSLPYPHIIPSPSFFYIPYIFSIH